MTGTPPADTPDRPERTPDMSSTPIGRAAAYQAARRAEDARALVEMEERTLAASAADPDDDFLADVASDIRAHREMDRRRAQWDAEDRAKEGR